MSTKIEKQNIDNQNQTDFNYKGYVGGKLDTTKPPKNGSLKPVQSNNSQTSNESKK